MSSELKIGWGKADVTPKGPCMLAGQMGNRLALEVIDPLTTTALALESGDEQIIIISLDSVSFQPPLMKEVRKRVHEATGMPELNIIGSATHTHTAPQYGDVIPEKDWNHPYHGKRCRGNIGIIPAEIRKEHPDFVDSEQYFDFLCERISEAAVSAWQARKPGKVAYGIGTACVGESRRLVMEYRGGVMYAQEDDPALLHAEGHVDHTVNVLATYTPEGKLIGMIVNIACPAQVSEALSLVSADYWNEVRKEVARHLGEGIYLLPQCSAAGDISPHQLLNRRAQARMMQLRGQLKDPVLDWKWVSRVHNLEYSLARRKEIGRRVMLALEDVLGVIGGTADGAPVLKHVCKMLQLPPRLITREEAEAAQKSAEKLEEHFRVNEGGIWNGSVNWNRGVVERYKNPPKAIPMELHVIRLGDVAFATNSYELYLDYGDRIKGGSRAEQTFLVQLSAGRGSYLPSRRSGTTGYGSAPASSLVTFDGGNMIVEESVKTINSLF